MLSKCNLRSPYCCLQNEDVAVVSHIASSRPRREATLNKSYNEDATGKLVDKLLKEAKKEAYEVKPHMCTKHELICSSIKLIHHLRALFPLGNRGRRAGRSQNKKKVIPTKVKT